MAASDGDDRCGYFACGHQTSEIERVARQDLVARGRNEGEQSVDDIAKSALRQQLAGPLRSIQIGRPHIKHRQQPSQARLPRAIAPDLRDDRSGRHQIRSRSPTELDESRHPPVVTFHRDERAGIQHQIHAADRARPAGT